MVAETNALTQETPTALPASSAGYWQQLAATTRVWIEDAPSFGRLAVRVEWATTDHGPACTMGHAAVTYSRKYGYRVSGFDWLYDLPPDDIERLVKEVVEEEEQTAHGCFVDYETRSQMFDAVEELPTYAGWREAMEAEYEAKKVSPESELANALLANVYPPKAVR